MARSQINPCHPWAKFNSLTKTTLSLFSYWICSSHINIHQVILSTHYNCAHSDRTSEPPQYNMFGEWGAQARSTWPHQSCGGVGIWQTECGKQLRGPLCSDWDALKHPCLMPVQFCILIISLFGHMECNPSMAACEQSTVQSKQTWQSQCTI